MGSVIEESPGFWGTKVDSMNIEAGQCWVDGIDIIYLNCDLFFLQY